MQDSDHDLPTVPLPWRHVGIGVHTPNDRGGCNVSGSDENAVSVSGVQSVVGRSVPSNAPPDPVWCGTGVSG